MNMDKLIYQTELEAGMLRLFGVCRMEGTKRERREWERKYGPRKWYMEVVHRKVQGKFYARIMEAATTHTFVFRGKVYPITAFSIMYYALPRSAQKLKPLVAALSTLRHVDLWGVLDNDPMGKVCFLSDKQCQWVCEAMAQSTSIEVLMIPSCDRTPQMQSLVGLLNASTSLKALTVNVSDDCYRYAVTRAAMSSPAPLEMLYLYSTMRPSRAIDKLDGSRYNGEIKVVFHSGGKETVLSRDIPICRECEHAICAH